jgi:rod shape-determining protein MreD
MSNSSNGFLIFFSLVAALILTLLPMPDWTMWLRPAWVLLILIYWTMENPYAVNVGLAWFIGIILDVLNGTLLGEHALALTIVIYITSRMQSQMRMFSLLQQGLIVFLLVLLYQVVIYCTQGFLGNLPHDWLYWMSSITSMLLWPWVYSIMRDSRRRFKAV